MPGASVDQVPAVLPVQAPTRDDYGLGAVGRTAVVITGVDEVLTAAPFAGPDPGVVHEREGSDGP